MYLILYICFEFCKSGAGSRYLFAAPNSSYGLLHPFFRLSTWPMQGSLPAHGLLGLGLGLGINQTFYSICLIIENRNLLYYTYLVPAKGISTFSNGGNSTLIHSPSYEPPCSRSLYSPTVNYQPTIACQLAIDLLWALAHPTWRTPATRFSLTSAQQLFRGINSLLHREIRFSVSLGIVNSHEGFLPLLSLSSFFLFERQSTTQSGRQSGFVLQVLASVNLLGELQPALFSLSFPSLKSSQPQLLNYVQLRLYGFFVDATLLPSTGHPSQLRHDVCCVRFALPQGGQ